MPPATRTFAEMKAAAEAHNEAQDKTLLARIVEEMTEEAAAGITCEETGCNNRVSEPGDICHGCEADQSHRDLWGTGIPMSHHLPS